MKNKTLNRRKIRLFIIVGFTFLLGFIQLNSAPLTEKVAKETAEKFLSNFNKKKEFLDARIEKLFPIYDYAKPDSIIAYEVKLITSEHKNNGHIILGGPDLHPIILEFSSWEECIWDKFDNNLNHKEFRMCMFSPFYWIALNPAGKIISSIGTISILPENIQKGGSNEEYHLRIYKSIRDQLANRNKLDVLRNKTKNTKMLYQNAGNWSGEDIGISDTSYVTYHIESEDKVPHLYQVPPSGTGYQTANSKDFMSGCGATAWVTLIAYHDLAFTPSLLRGSQNSMGPSGVGGNPNQESSNENYLSRLTMCLSSFLGTYKCECNGMDNCGCVETDNMWKGFSFIRTVLHHNIIGGCTWSVDCDNNRVVDIYNRITIDRRPAVIDIPLHSCVAVGFILILTALNDMDAHFLIVNDGLNSNNINISTSLFTDFFYFKTAYPVSSSINVYPVPFNAIQPELISVQRSGNIKDQLWAFCLGDDKKIYYTSSIEGTSFHMGVNKILDVQAKYSPSLCSSGNKLYLAYVDNTNSIHLMMYVIDKDVWYDLYFPPDIKTNVRPAICGSIGDFFTVVFSNSKGVQIIASNRDIQRPNTWPSDFVNNPTGYPDYLWMVLDLKSTSLPIKVLRTTDNKTLAFWLDGRQDMWINGKNYNRSTIFYFGERNGEHPFPNQVMHENIQLTSSVLSNKEIYLLDDMKNIYSFSCWRDGNDFKYQLTQLADLNSAMEIINLSLLRQEDGDASLSFVESENGNHPLLLTSWMAYSYFLPSTTFLNVWSLSIDSWYHPISYNNQPECYYGN
jgi:hypothetical protein